MISAMTSAPTLQTERLVLRGPDPKDVAQYTTFFLSERARFVGGGVGTTRRHAWEFFALEFGHWHIRGFGMWAVTRKGCDTALGYVGAWCPESWPEAELGWVMFEGAEGQGIAFEAASAARAHVYGPMGWKTAVSYIAPENTRSIALAERLGAMPDSAASCPPGPKPCLVYRHPAPGVLAGISTGAIQ